MKKLDKDELAGAIHEMAIGITNAGLMPKSTMREIEELCGSPVEKLSPDENPAIREESLVSQAVFARHLNVTTGILSQWERGEKSPSGSSLKLLTLVKTKGLGCIA